MSAAGLLLFSATGVCGLMLLARLLGFARRPVLTDAAMAARLAGHGTPGFVAEDIVISRDGSAALVAARDGRVVLVRALGDRFVVRALVKPKVVQGGGVLRVRPDEAMFPETALDLGDAAAAARWAALL